MQVSVSVVTPASEKFWNRFGEEHIRNIQVAAEWPSVFE
jgi:predicted acetyltransferase